MRHSLLRHFFSAILFSVVDVCLATAQTSIISVQPELNPPVGIVVSFANPWPSEADVRVNRNWSIVVQSSTRHWTLHVNKVDTSGIRGANGNPPDGSVKLFTTEPLNGLCDPNASADDKPQTIEVVFSPKSIYLHSKPHPIICSPGQSSNAFKAAKKESDSDFYVKSSFTGVDKGDPQWDLDAFVGYMKEFNEYGALGGYGQASTNSAKTADLDSFLAYGVYELPLLQGVISRRVASGKDGLIGPFQAPYFAFRFAGGEFDRDNSQLNFITSPTLVIPWRLSGHVNKAIPENLQLPQFTTTLGVEAVNPHKSALPITDSWYVRGLIGNTFSFGYTPDSPHFNSISVSSNWQVRLPSAPEIFYDPKFAPIKADGSKGDPPPMKGTQPRHFFDTTLTYGLVDWVGVSFEYSFGSLPPSFSVTDHTFKIGICLTLKQSSTGRYAILRPVPSS